MSPEHTYLLERAKHYCAYTERSIFDIKKKLQLWKASDKTIEEIIPALEEQDYINEERYAVSFAYGKMRNNKWGRAKIFHALSQKNIPEIYIQMGLNELDEEEYLNTLKSVVASKKATGKDEFTRQNKLVKYAVQKGFQADLAWKVIKGEL
ncbi:MAG: RecX family transcriptional regulator [Bacteroidetes bacterium]|nr:MAG: RecX family transcriptional regulator [Bacteroidota bacterium]